MVAVPGATPPTVPTVTVATPVLSLLHAPPVGVLVNVVVVPADKLAVPEIAVGNAFTVIIAVAANVPHVFVTV